MTAFYPQLLLHLNEVVVFLANFIREALATTGLYRRTVIAARTPHINHCLRVGGPFALHRLKALEAIDLILAEQKGAMKLVGTPHQVRALSFLDETYPPGADTGDEMLNHEGEEAGVLVEGRLELTVGSEIFILESGDSYYFESTKPHRFRNPFDQPARLISATTPANF